MTVSALFLAGRFLLAVPFVVIGVDAVQGDEVDGASRVWAVLATLAAAAVVLGLWGDVAAFALAATIAGLGVAERRLDRRALLVGLLGGALCVAALYAAVGDAIDFTITDPVLDLDLR